MGYNCGHPLYTTNPRDGINIRGRGQHTGDAIVDDHTSDSIPTKVCSTCHCDKVLSEFNHNRAMRDGYANVCRSCMKVYQSDFYSRNKEAKRAYGKTHYAENRERIRKRHLEYAITHKEQGKERSRRSYLKHKAKRLEQGRIWRKSNVERSRAYVRKWAKSNPDKIRVNVRNYWARKRHASGTHTTQDIQRQGNIQKWRCWWCGKKCQKKYQVDHLVPLAKGGHNDPTNLVISCPTCNQSKQDKLPHEWCGRLL